MKIRFTYDALRPRRDGSACLSVACIYRSGWRGGGYIGIEYLALTVGLPDELFSGIQPLLSMHMRLMASVTVKDAGYLLERHEFHLLIVNMEYLRSVHQSDWLSGIRRISFAPMIVLSETPEQDLHQMVQLGADICVSISRPYAIIADLAQSQLRRYTEYNHYSGPGNIGASPFREGDIFIDPLRRLVKVRDRTVHLRPREFSLLLYFMRNPNVVLSSERICSHVWGITAGYDGGISHPIYLLRKQIEPDPQKPIYIQTVYGFGYRFAPNFVETCDKCENIVRGLS